jgi:hypothetical protein
MLIENTVDAGQGPSWIVIQNKRLCAVNDLGEPREAACL